MEAARSYRKYWAPLLIVAAVLAAHAGALDSTFYLDDWWQVMDSDGVEGGEWYASRFVLLTNLSYFLTWKVFGFSTFWFHLFNLLLHLAGALAIYYLGRHLITSDEASTSRQAVPAVAALIAALIFATHPLTTEVVNYVRARDHGMVGFFSFLAACFTALGMKRHRLWLLAAAGAMAAAALTKGPGLPQALLAVMIVAAAFSTRERWRRIFPNRWWIYGAILLAEAAWFFFSATVVDLVQIFWLQSVGEWRFGWHSLTQCRVFWSYVWLAVWPSGLCSDHLYAWTRSLGDSQAWAAAICLLGLIVAIVWLWWRKRQPWAMLAALAVSALLLRWLYVVSELMVEYRTYPAMPYVALIAGLGIACWWRRMPRSAIAFTALLLVCYATLSHQRSEEWSSAERLNQTILLQYPWQLRSLNGLSNDDIRNERWQGILERYPDFSKRLAEVLAENKANPNRYYENWPLWAVTEETLVAEALLHTKGADVAERYLNNLAERMRSNRIDHKMLWADWELAAGKVAAARGDRQAALAHFREAIKNHPSKRTVRKEMLKLGANSQD